MTNCIFCKIVNKEIPATVVYEDENYMAFNDINPKMKTHILIIPKKHIERFDNLRSEEGQKRSEEEGDKNTTLTAEEKENLEIVKGLLEVAYKIIKEKQLDGCRLQINCGENHGQEVFHIHLHLMSQS